MPKKKPLVSRDNYIPPKNKKQLIAYINEAGIKDIRCESNFFEGQLTFSLQFTTKDDKQFYFDQQIECSFKFNPVEVLDFSTGNGYEIEADIGTQFDPNNRSNSNTTPSWSVSKCE